jgi:hypothetical protein
MLTQNIISYVIEWKDENMLSLMKFSQAVSWVKWLNGEKTNVSKTISVLVWHPEDKYRDGLRNVGFFHHSTT